MSAARLSFLSLPSLALILELVHDYYSTGIVYGWNGILVALSTSRTALGTRPLVTMTIISMDVLVVVISIDFTYLALVVILLVFVPSFKQYDRDISHKHVIGRRAVRSTRQR